MRIAHVCQQIYVFYTYTCNIARRFYVEPSFVVSMNISAMPMTFSTGIYPHPHTDSLSLLRSLFASTHTQRTLQYVRAQLVFLHVVHTSCDSFAVVAALWFRRHSVMFSWKRVFNRYASEFFFCKLVPSVDFFLERNLILNLFMYIIRFGI